jgi:hypothetical protein
MLTVEDCSIRLMLGLVSSILMRKERRARKMFKLVYSVSYYIRIVHRMNPAKNQTSRDSDKYMNCFTGHESQFINLIGGILSYAIWSM